MYLFWIHFLHIWSCLTRSSHLGHLRSNETWLYTFAQDLSFHCFMVAMDSGEEIFGSEHLEYLLRAVSSISSNAQSETSTDARVEISPILRLHLRQVNGILTQEMGSRVLPRRSLEVRPNQLPVSLQISTGTQQPCAKPSIPQETIDKNTRRYTYKKGECPVRSSPVGSFPGAEETDKNSSDDHSGMPPAKKAKQELSPENSDSGDGVDDRAESIKDEDQRENPRAEDSEEIPKGDDTEDSPDICTICQNEMEDGQDARCLPCLHIFHTKCIDNWLRITKTCPVCRSDVEKGNGTFHATPWRTNNDSTA